MIVAAWGRSGGTKFCMDLSEKTGLPFIGEMHPGNTNEAGAFRALGKKKNHETNHDQQYSMHQFLEYAKNPDNVIILANDMHWSILPKADYFLFRKSIRNALLSIGNLTVKSIHGYDPNIDSTEVLIQMITVCREMFTLNYASIHYALNNDINLTWYEDYFNNKPTLTPHLDQFELNHKFYSFINQLIADHDIEDLLLKLQEKKG